MKKLGFPLIRLTLAVVFVSLCGTAQADATAPPQTIPARSGDLLIAGKPNTPQIACPLERTDVKADVTGLSARVHVRQVFRNPLTTPIEAVYVFPLPEDAAVDDMTMEIGKRRIRAAIKPREEAQKIYENAKNAGQTASLLDQERPNIFTQSVANITPGAKIVIEIAYVQAVKYEDGLYEWNFPMVVGPRYMPGVPTGKKGAGWSNDTTHVPDASRISPPVAPPTMRAGHNINLQVNIKTGHNNRGVQLREITSVLHAVKIENKTDGATVSLANKQEIPNRDFVLRYRTATNEIGDSFLTHTDKRGQFFTLTLQPPQRVERQNAMPRELIFVLDTSGSMSGFPIEKAKAVMKRAIDNLGPRDEFNLITFAGDTRILWETPRPATPENLKNAQSFLAGQSGGGGTEMMKAINTALEGQDKERVRIVCFMTDGYVGNDFAIVDAIKKNAGTARVFSFGIGDSVNRFLLENMAAAGRGAAEFVLLASDGDAVSKRFYDRINKPVLTDIEVNWGNLPVVSTYPKHIPDLFSRSPLVITGRLKPGAVVPEKSTVTLRGRNANGNFARNLPITWQISDKNDTLPTLWARERIDYLMNQDMAGLQNGNFPKELKEEITLLGVTYRLMTQFTSFVAVEDKVVNVNGKPQTLTVPVDMPNGVSYEGVFGEDTDQALGMKYRMNRPANPASAPAAIRATRRVRDKKADTGGGPMLAPMPAPRISTETTSSQDVTQNTVAGKLVPPLDTLVRRVDARGNFNAGNIRVTNYRVRVKITLRDASAATRSALQNLGFQKTTENLALSEFTGTIDVRKLQELAKLYSVIKVEAVRNVATVGQP